MDAFERWLLRRSAQAVEADQLSGELLTELQAEFEAARYTPQESVQAKAIRDIGMILGVSQEQAEKILASLQAQPRLVRQVLMRCIAEAWLAGQQKVPQTSRVRGG